ncbi:hypothetical protein FDP41_011359 [Naegleria fowleri]|uniref:Uncharacterized protein n=1 Tax=Naegleria fowleri TaxID=5763 RepID=A0A6A5CAZ5_NAEFO|nr:uncharacterized protein FDP41_011359 [Naegleria fowleri]KAF0982429.1 hypothetical protein FDP41_011359 [Naegleria fowleri]CAG4716232.1 unnamed protein product [Naegleria fowleri]
MEHDDGNRSSSMMVYNSRIQTFESEQQESDDDERGEELNENTHVGNKFINWKEYMMTAHSLLDQQITSRVEENQNLSLLQLLHHQLEGIIGPVISNSKMIQHPRFPNQFYFTKSPHFLFETFKERIDTKKHEIINSQRKNEKGFIKFGNLIGSEEYYFLLIQDLIQKHLKDVSDHCGFFTTCLYSLVKQVQRKKNNFQHSISWMKYQRGLSKSIAYFVQILLPEVVLPELINLCECVDPFETPEDTLYNICYTFLIPHVSSSIANTLSHLMINWLSMMDMPAIYKISANRELFDFIVHAIPFANTESGSKLLPGILVGEASFVQSKVFSFHSHNGVKCLPLKQVELSHKNIEIEIHKDYMSLKQSLAKEIEDFIAELERNHIGIVLSEDILDDMLVLALAKRNILCIHHVSDMDRICEVFNVIPLLIHSITRYNNDTRRHELLSFGKYSHLKDHLLTCKSIKQLPLGPMKQMLFLEPTNTDLSPYSNSVLIRAPMESLAETYRNLFFRLLRYLTNSFKFLTQDPNMPTIAILSGGCYFENKLSGLLQYIKTNFKMRTMPELDSLLEMLTETYEAVCVTLLENLIPNKQQCHHRDLLMQLKSRDSMIVSFMHTPKQHETISVLTELHQNGGDSSMSNLIGEGLLIVPNSKANRIGIYETLSCKYSTLINVCMSLKKLLDMDGFFF